MQVLQDYFCFNKLQALAKKRPALCKENLDRQDYWEDHKINYVGFDYFFATQQISQEILEALYAMSDEARLIDRLHAVFSGKIMNYLQEGPSENRPVLHMLMRDAAGRSPATKDYADFISQEWQKLEALEKKITSKGITTIYLVGIGGSELGPKAIYYALKPQAKTSRNLKIISNLDPDALYSELSHECLEKALFCVVSKSGHTLETRSCQEAIEGTLKQNGLSLKEHMLVVTQKNSPLDHDNFLERFYMLEGVGGRFSLSSMVGAVPLGLTLGLDVFQEFLRGAEDGDQHALTKTARENAPLMAALLTIWNHNFLHYSSQCIVPYSSLLEFFPGHIQQVAMESNGKQLSQAAKPLADQTCPIIWGGVGCNVQHSFFQLLHQGTEIVPVDFIAFTEPNSEKSFPFAKKMQQELLSSVLGQIMALALGKVDNDVPNQHFFGNRPSSLLLGKTISPYSIGSLLAFYENKVMFEGFLWGINSFDQEGVQLGKKVANDFISYFSGKNTSFTLGKIFDSFICRG